MMRVALAWTPLLLFGCAADSGGDGANDELLRALPGEVTMAVAGPSGTAGAAGAGGEPAPLWAATRQAAEGMNGTVGRVLGDLHAITATPPSAQGDGWAMWGPMTPFLSPASYRVVIQEIAPGRPSYRLEGRPRSAGDEAFRPVLWGTSGAFQVDEDLAHGLDPLEHPGRGRLDVHFGVSTIAVHHQDGDAVTDYAFAAAPDGSGNLSITHAGGRLRARWAADGSGRAEAEGPDGAIEVQCWDRSFVLVPCGNP